MLFEAGTARMNSLFATHPPLIERIRALDPSFRETDYPLVDPRTRRTVTRSAQAAAIADAGRDAEIAAGKTIDFAQSIGQPEPQHVAYAQRIRRSIPKPLYDAAHAPEAAFLLAIALVLDERHAERQLHLVGEQLGAERAETVRNYFWEIGTLGPRYRLPLLEIAFPTLRTRPKSQTEYLLELVKRLIEIDGRVSLREFCVYRVLASHLSQAADPLADKPGNRAPRKQARIAALDLLRIVADQGNEDDRAREHAYQAGISAFGAWAAKAGRPAAGEQTVRVLGRSLDILRRINSAGKKSLLQAVSNTISHDGKLTLSEAEMLRAICASLDCPLPPLGLD